ncbi:FAD-dependent oxidoreductase [Desulfobacterales bacterium HSG2]|nr:FAD-dependent oxidoreductase [Desulfobacterales bacterium HSG2]
MGNVKLTINNQEIEAPAGTTILKAARSADIYIPTLCHHPNLPPAKQGQPAKAVFQGNLKIRNAMPDEPAKGCGLCVVEVEGQPDLAGSCATPVHEGMVIVTENDRITAKRQENLIPILARHRHACLTCAQQEGCPRSQCSSNVHENERCCPQFGHCELQNVANHIGISDATPKWIPTNLPVFKDHPLFERDYNLCIGCTRCVRACRDLRGVEAIGFVHDGKGNTRVGTMRPTLEDSECKFCTACVEVCPTGALTERAVHPGRKEAELVPCKEACPAHIDIPGYLRLIAEGKRDEAHAVIREKVPFPGILGRVCFHPCEEACRRGKVNKPISICALKRYAADGEKGLWKKNSKVKSDTGKKVAVVGSGPAGLTAAFYLGKQGHSVTIFESRTHAGGMMRYGIPAYRLPCDVLEKEIRDILDTGIDFRPGQTLGRDFTLKSLKNDGYDAVFVGTGAQLSRRVPLDGHDLPDVLWGVDFLRQVAEGEEVRLRENVLVIGGGNVAVDVAMTALRCGAEEVKMACLECETDMPASPWELAGAVAEGIQIMPSRGPDKILIEDGRITGMDMMECTCVFDAQGNFCPQFSDEKECIPTDQIILAIGQDSDLSFLQEADPISVDKGLIVADQETLETGMKGVYAGGDATKVPGSVIHAIAAGRKAASSMDKALGGTGDIEEVLFQRGDPVQYIGRDEGFVSWPRERVHELEPEARKKSFEEISIGYDETQTVKEARRCLQCDLRLYMDCNPSPPASLLAFTEENISQVPETEGVFQLLDEDHNVLVIKGTADIRKELLIARDENGKAVLFKFEEDKMYSRRESELIQKYLQEHGRMPGGDDDDELF